MKSMRWLALLCFLSLAACGGGGDSPSFPGVPAPAAVGTTPEPPVVVVPPPAPTVVKSDPPRFAFLMEILPVESTTIYRVRGVEPSACLAFTVNGCIPPASVDLYLGADRVTTLAGPNNGTRSTPSYPTYDSFLPSVVSGPQVFRVVVTLPADASGVVYRQEGLMPYETGATNNRQITIAGPGTTLQLAVVGGRANDVSNRVGDNIVVAAIGTGTDPVPPGVLKLLEKPAGSIALLPATSPAGTASFIADRIGRFTVEYSPVMADGKLGPPLYAVVQVVPQLVRIAASVGSSFSAGDIPPAPATATRVYVSPSSTRGIASVQVLLDGVSLGLLTQPNVQQFSVCNARGCTGTAQYSPAWAFDFDTRAVASGSHMLRILLTDIAGHVFEVPLPVPGNGFASQEFTDNNP